MLDLLITSITSSLGKEVVEEIAKSIFKARTRTKIKRAIRDIIEDELHRFGRENDIPLEIIEDYIDDEKRAIRKEVRIRFDPILRK